MSFDQKEFLSESSGFMALESYQNEKVEELEKELSSERQQFISFKIKTEQQIEMLKEQLAKLTPEKSQMPAAAAIQKLGIFSLTAHESMVDEKSLALKHVCLLKS